MTEILSAPGMSDGKDSHELKDILADKSIETTPNPLELKIEHTNFGYEPFNYIVERMKIVGRDDVPEGIDPDAVVHVHLFGHENERATKIAAYSEFLRQSRRWGNEGSEPGLIEQYRAESSDHFRQALEAIPSMKRYAPCEQTTLSAASGGEPLGQIEVHNYIQPLRDEQHRAITAAVDFLYQFFGAKTYEILKDIIIAPLGPGDRPYDPDAPQGQVVREVPGVIYLGPELCGSPISVAAGGQFELGPGTINLLPIVLIHEFAHLLHFSGEEIDPSALLRFSQAVGWDIDEIPEYPEGGESAPGYNGQDATSIPPTDYGTTHPYETLTETAAVLGPSERLATELSGTRDAWLTYIDDLGYPSPAASVNRPTYDYIVKRVGSAAPLPNTIYVVSS